MKLSDVKDKLADKRPDLAAYLSATKDKRALATELCSARLKAKLTQAQLAEIAGIDLAVVQQLETPSGPLPSPDSVAKLLKACSASSVMGEQQP